MIAVSMLNRDNLIKKAVLIGNKGKIIENARSTSTDMDCIDIIDIENDKVDRKYRDAYQKARNLSVLEGERLDEAMMDPVIVGALILSLGEVEGFIGGLQTITADILSTGIQIIKADRRIGVVTSLCLIQTEDKSIGEDGFFLIADPIVNRDPSVGVLCKIAEASARFAREFLKIKPRIAFLSYSTRGSGIGKSVDKMRIASERSKTYMPELIIDGELQFDAAVMPDIARIKAPDSPLEGRANILVFPNLNAANIGSKLIRIFGKAKLIGPIIYGLNKPYNDISRGADESDVYDLAIITQLQHK